MSWLVHGLVSLALLGIQEAKGDPKPKQDSGKEDPKQAQDPKREEEAQLLQAVRNETELRDFAKALESWRSVQAAAEKTGKKELVTKAELGCARCLLALGRNDEAKAVLDAVLASDPKNAEAKSALARFLAGGQVVDDIKEIVRQLADVALSLTSAQDEGRIKKAQIDLIRMSDVAVPQLADSLRDHRVGVVDGAAEMLVQMNTERSFEALAAAMRDPRCRYPKVLIDRVSGSGGDALLPFFEATLERTEPEFRRWAAERMKGSIDGLTPEQQVEVAKRLLADPDVSVRFEFFENTWFNAPAVLLLEPTIEALVDAKDEAAQKSAIFFLARNRNTLPNETAARWSARLARSPIASVRVSLLDREFEAACGGPVVDPRRRGLVLLKYLSDDDPSVFSAGSTILEQASSWSQAGAFAGSGEAVASALHRALDLRGVSLDRRYVILTQLPLLEIGDDELLALFVRLATAPDDADGAWRASIRERIGIELMSRVKLERRDSFAAERLPKIPDAAGMRQWYDLARRGVVNWTFMSLDLAAARSDDVKLRVAAYHGLSSGARSDRLPHVAVDLQDPDPSVVLAATRAIGWGERPDLVKPLRDLIARGPGDLHDAALRALANVGGKAVADELLAMMKASPKDADFRYLRQLEQALGPERLAQELVAIAQSDGTSNRVVLWMRDGNTVAVSSECASAFVRQLPPNLVGTNVFDILSNQLAPDVLATLVCRQLGEGKGSELERAAELAGVYHVEAAWPGLMALLDTGAGQVRETAIASLQSIKQFRELRRSFAADEDSDVRRTAFEKAKAMTKSTNAEQRSGAAIALAATGDVAAIPLLLDLLGDGDESVKVAARKALERLADRAVAPPAEASKGGAEKSGEEVKGKKKGS